MPNYYKLNKLSKLLDKIKELSDKYEYEERIKLYSYYDWLMRDADKLAFELSYINSL